MSVECKNLDAYLGDDLSPHDRARYDAHLFGCEACREALNHQHWIDALLSSPERLALERVSPSLAGSVRDSIAWRRLQARLVACGLAAAAVLVLAVGWTAMLSRQAKVPYVDQIAETGDLINEPAPSPSLRGRVNAETPRAVFVAGPDVITVPIESRYPNITIVRVYSTYQSSRAAPDVNDDSDADYFNGG